MDVYANVLPTVGPKAPHQQRFYPHPQGATQLKTLTFVTRNLLFQMLSVCTLCRPSGVDLQP